MSPEERALRANRASIELPQTEIAFAELRDAIVEKWAATSVDHVATREKLFLSIQALDAVRKALMRSAADGVMLRHAEETAALLAPAAEDRRR